MLSNHLPFIVAAAVVPVFFPPALHAALINMCPAGHECLLMHREHRGSVETFKSPVLIDPNRRQWTRLAGGLAVFAFSFERAL